MEILKKHTFTSQVIDHVHESLRAGLYWPGMPITEQMLVDTLGASRAPIREALQALANEGLVTSYPYKGRVIREMSTQEILDNAYLVGVIEGALAARALAYQTDEDFAHMKKLVADMELVAARGGNIQDMESLANEFHQVLCGCRHLAEITSYARRICRNISRILYYKYWKEIFSLEQRARRHRLVLEAVLTGDQLYLEAIVRRHQMEVGEEICRLMLSDKTNRQATDSVNMPETHSDGAR